MKHIVHSHLPIVGLALIGKSARGFWGGTWRHSEETTSCIRNIGEVDSHAYQPVYLPDFIRSSIKCHRLDFAPFLLCIS